MVFPVVPVAIAGGAVVVTGIGLRLRAVAKQKEAAAAAAALPAGSTPAAIPAAVPAAVAAQPQATPAAVAAAAASAGLTVDQVTQAAAAAGTTPAAVVGAAQAAGSSVADALIAAAQADPNLQAQINPAAVTSIPQGATVQLGQVTTNDPIPSGDLVIRDQPNGTQIGGAEKNGMVTVVNPDVDGDFAQISWAGGSRLPAADGFAHKKFIRLL